MQELFASLPNFGPDAYIFTTTGGARPISGFSKEQGPFRPDARRLVGRWQLHDLRRTTRTGLASAGVPVFDAELIVAHQQSGVHGTYDRHRYQEEKLAGLLKWEAKLTEILEPPPENVVALRPTG